MSDNTNNINSKDFIIGTLIGGVVGASIALLMAPKSGKELRTDLNDQASVIRERTNQLTASAKEKGTEFAEVAREKGDYLSKTISEQSAQIVDKVKSLRNEEEEVFASYEDLDTEMEDNPSPEVAEEEAKQNSSEVRV